MKNNDIPELRNMGPKLVIVRRNSGKSQEKFAADYGVTQGTMSKYENGHTKLPVELMASNTIFRRTARLSASSFLSL